jgi:mannose-6-phosphate isomerase class I
MVFRLQGGSAMQSYPIKLTYHVRTYAFGGRLIPERLGKKDAPGGTIAETWEVSDYREARGTVTNGSYAGRTLHDLTLEYPDELVGEGWRGPHFPLLEKFLDATHMLPVHLHADDETARLKHSEPHGKTEAWHVLWAAEDATILAGVEEGLRRDELYDAFKKQDYDSVMLRLPVHAAGPYFALERWTLTEPHTEPSHPRRFLTLSNVGDQVSLEHADGTERLDRAESYVLPAALGEMRVTPGGAGEASLVACYVPDLEEDVVTPLQSAGYSDAEIRALGELDV